MISFIISFAIVVIAALLVFILGSLRWKIEKLPVSDIETVEVNLKDFAKLLKEAGK